MLKIQSIPQTEHNTSLLQRLTGILFKEMLAVYSENHMKPINTLCGHNTELLIVKVAGTYSYHWVLNG
jgi:hypothetical protein